MHLEPWSWSCHHNIAEITYIQTLTNCAVIELQTRRFCSGVCFYKTKYSVHIFYRLLILKRLGAQFNPSCGFLKSESSKENVKPWFFVTFNVIVSHNFPQISLKFITSFRSYEEFLCQYYLFLLFFIIFLDFLNISLLQRN